MICVILECKAPTERLPEILDALQKVSQEIDTVFSLDMITVQEEDGSLPNVEIARKLGYRDPAECKNDGRVRPAALSRVGDANCDAYHPSFWKSRRSRRGLLDHFLFGKRGQPAGVPAKDPEVS